MSRRTCVILLAAALFLTLLHPRTSADAQALAELVANIQSDDAAVRREAFGQLRAMGAEGVQALLGMLVEPGKGDDAGARFALHGMAVQVSRTGAEAERAGFGEALARHLSTDAPPAVKRFVITQLQIAGRAESVAALAACLSDDELVNPACQALIANPSPEAVVALRDALAKSTGATRVPIIEALGERRDAEAVAVLADAAKSSRAEVRMAAIAALGRIGDLEAEPVIAAALGKGPERERRVAFDAYLHLAEELRRTGKRREAVTVYTRALQAAPTPALRTAALLGIGGAGYARDVNAIVPHVADPDPVLRHAARHALVRMRGPKVANAIRQRLKKSEPSVRAGLLHVLVGRDEPAATKAIEAATKDPSAEVRVTACQLLDRLDDPTLEQTLLEAATSGSDAIHPVALEAYMRLAEARAQEKKSDDARNLYTRALDIARTDALRGMALRGMATVPSLESLPKVERLLEQEGVRDDALRAYVAIAGRMAETDDKQRGIEMLQRALEMGPARDVGQMAVAKLRDLGVDIDPARSGGFVTSWWVIGPFPGETVRQEWPPEKGVDLTATVTAGDRGLRWVKHHTDDIMGVVNLAALMKPNQRVTAYACAEVSVERAQEVLFKMGSDDGLKLWLNGRMIHRAPQPRSLTVDEDAVEAQLAAGVNRILVKVVNGGGGWEFCLRITDRDGRPSEFEQEEN